MAFVKVTPSGVSNGPGVSIEATWEERTTGLDFGYALRAMDQQCVMEMASKPGHYYRTATTTSGEKMLQWRRSTASIWEIMFCATLSQIYATDWRIVPEEAL